MSGNLNFDQLKSLIKSNEIDTVVVAITDMQGRLMGKRFHASHFVNAAWEETHCCTYLIATDQEMETVQGYDSANWGRGYGDYIIKPDMSTLRLAPWLEKTVIVQADLLDHHTHEDVPHSPRAVLKHQIARLEKHGLKAFFATELEFFVFRESYEELYKKAYRNMDLVSAYNQDYHIFQTTKEENLMRAIRNGLVGAGVCVESTKGEASAGQEELNVKYSDALDMADTHSFIKNAVKEIAWAKGQAVTFLAKWNNDAAGSSSHIHQSLRSLDGTPVFYNKKDKHGMSALMQSYLAGLLKYSSDITWFLAPFVNSYKRFVANTFAPTKIVWSMDNRTAGYRIVGEGTQNIRVECRIPGSDINPYLAFAGMIAAGLAGIEQKLKLEPMFTGDAYQKTEISKIPSTLREATKHLKDSKMLRDALGEEVLKHYAYCAEWEQRHFDAQVTDYELFRGFERN